MFTSILFFPHNRFLYSGPYLGIFKKAAFYVEENMYKEINNLLEKSRKGDVSSKEKILKNLKPLIISSIERYYNKRQDFDDLIQEGYLVVLQCIENYDESKEVYFLGYVKTMLKFTYLNKHKEKTYLSLNIAVGNDGDEELINLLESQDDGPLDLALNLEESREIQKVLLNLTNRQREVIIGYYVEGLSIKEISKRLSISYRTVVNTKTRALEKMKDSFYQY